MFIIIQTYDQRQSSCGILFFFNISGIVSLDLHYLAYPYHLFILFEIAIILKETWLLFLLAK